MSYDTIVNVAYWISSIIAIVILDFLSIAPPLVIALEGDSEE